jgi:hypothetical protein
MDRTPNVETPRLLVTLLALASTVVAACIDDAPRDAAEEEAALEVACVDAGDPVPVGAWVCGDDRIVECGTHAGAAVALIHADLAAMHVEDACVDLDLEPSAVGPFAVGEHEITVSRADEHASLCASRLVVVDTTPPVVSPGYLELWPPDHKLFWLTPEDCAAHAADTCDPDVEIELTWATSDEFADETGDGDTEEDIVDLGCDGVGLRAERDAQRDGRVYTVGYRATDDAGNATEGACTVVVRHDRGDLGPVQNNVEAYRVELAGCP